MVSKLIGWSPVDVGKLEAVTEALAEAAAMVAAAATAREALAPFACRVSKLALATKGCVQIA